MTWNPGAWLSDNWQYLVCWGVALGAMWRLHRIVSTFEAYGTGLENVEKNLTLVMSNHLPHLQIEMEKVNDNLTGLRTDVKDGLGRLSDSINVVLSRME